MATRVRIVIEYDFDVVDGSEITDSDLSREAFDWTSGHVGIADLFGAEANPTVKVERA